MNGEELLERCSRKTDQELFSALGSLDAEEAETLADVLAHLATLDRRRAAERLASGSLFVYCTRQLGYSEHEAYMRIRVARAIHVSAVARIAPYLTSENYRSLLGKAARRTREELERLVAELDPQPEKRPVIRTIAMGSNEPSAVEQRDSLFYAPPSKPDPAQALPVPATTPELAPSNPDKAGGSSPIAPPGRVLFSFTASAAIHAKFKLARDLLLHKYPRGDPEHVFDDALEALLDRKDPWRRIARKERRQRAGGGQTTISD